MAGVKINFSENSSINYIILKEILYDNAETVYVRVDVNKAYWVNGEEYGNVDLW